MKVWYFFPMEICNVQLYAPAQAPLGLAS